MLKKVNIKKFMYLPEQFKATAVDGELVIVTVTVERVGFKNSLVFLHCFNCSLFLPYLLTFISTILYRYDFFSFI